jgi:serine protease inhibitor
MARWPVITASLLVIGAAGIAFMKSPVALPDKKLVEADNRFAFKLFREMTKKQSGTNLFLSPPSVSLALSMTANGAGGKTKQAMLQTLELAAFKPAEINTGNRTLIKALQNPSPQVHVTIADALWADKRIKLNPAFVKTARDYYEAEARTLDLQAPTAPGIINGWVSQKTARKISSIVSANDLSNADAVLTNAIYFKGTWKYKFDKANTRNMDFTLPNGSKKQVPMMGAKGTYSTLALSDLSAVRLPYGSGDLSMLLFLPSPNSSLPRFLARLNTREWNSWLAGFGDAKLSWLGVPRFIVESSSELRPPLTSLGMGMAFQPGADFKPMGLAGSQIGAVKHKVKIEVNEEGTEAAAATAVVMWKGGEMSPRLIFDRPFFCAIQDNRTGAILFMGTVTNP